jgi:hypothetical protein
LTVSELEATSTTSDALASAATASLSAAVIPLLKGVLHRADDTATWDALLQLQGRVRDHVAVPGLELMLDEAEGYAFLRSRPDPDDESAPRVQLEHERNGFGQVEQAVAAICR